VARRRDVRGIQEPVAPRPHRGSQPPRGPNAASVLAAGHGDSEPRSDAPLAGAGVSEEPGFAAGPELPAGRFRSTSSPERRVQRHERVIRRADGSRRLGQRLCAHDRVDAVSLRLDPQDGVARSIAPYLRAPGRDVVEMSFGLDIEQVRGAFIRRALDHDLYGFEIVVVTDVGDAERGYPISRVKEHVRQIGVRSRQDRRAVHGGLEVAARGRQVPPIVGALPVPVEVDGQRRVGLRPARALLLHESRCETAQQLARFPSGGRVPVRKGERAAKPREQRYVLRVTGERDQRATSKHRERRERSPQAAEPAQEFS
jgi:hypothetical protein